MSQIAGHAFGLGKEYYPSYAAMAEAARAKVAEALELVAQADLLVANDAALTALKGKDATIDKVVDQVQFRTNLELTSAPVNRQLQGCPEQMGRPLALCLQKSALDTLGAMTGGTAGQIMAAIAKKVLAQFPLAPVAQGLYSELQSLTQPQNYWSPTDEGRLVHSSSWIAHAAEGTKVAATHQVCDLLLAGAAPTVETIKNLGRSVAATAKNEADARSVLGHTIQAVSLGHVRGTEATNIFDAEALEVSAGQKQAAAAVDVGPHFPRNGSYTKAWDRPVSLQWLEDAIDSIPNNG